VQSCKELKPSTIQKCFYNTLKMDIFKPAEPAETSEIKIAMNGLLEAIQKYSGVAELKIMDMVEYLTYDNDFTLCNANDEDSECEEIHIPDPNMFLKERHIIFIIFHYKIIVHL
jgi:hypothetical protein